MAGRALVLGGGGVTGVAWELGVLAGLAEQGLDLSEADLVVGTSAGSVVGAQLTSGVSPADLYAAQLAPPGAEMVARMGLLLTLKYGWVLVRSRDPVQARARFGRMALATRTVSAAERRAVFEAGLASNGWPDQRLLITAVDADSGEFAAFDAASGVGLVDAVGASCAVPGVWPPVSINGQRWIDGGMRSSANADLAADCERIVVIAPLIRGFRTMPSVATQVAELRSGGRAVAVVSPDQAALAAIGRNVLDPARRAPAAQAGHAQAAKVAAEVAAVWQEGPVARP
jgi:NTE family protein